MLVPAVLRPENGEDGELEVVRGAGEQFPDTVELPVGETEGPVEGLLCDRGQAASLTAASDGLAGEPEGRRARGR